MKAERERRETLLQAEGHKQAVITRAEGDKQAAILTAEGERDARIALAEGEAKALLLAKQAEADGLRALKEANPTAAVIELKKYESLIAMANGRSAKLIVPTDAVEAVTRNSIFTETTGFASSTTSTFTDSPGFITSAISSFSLLYRIVRSCNSNGVVFFIVTISCAMSCSAYVTLSFTLNAAKPATAPITSIPIIIFLKSFFIYKILSFMMSSLCSSIIVTSF